MSSLSSKVLKYMHERVFHRKSEYCANVKVGEEKELVLTDLTAGPPDGSTCSWKQYSKIMFHTHPVSRHAYPSIQDLELLVRHLNVQTSLVATSWGIFQLYQIKAHGTKQTFHREHVLNHLAVLHQIGKNKTWNNFSTQDKQMITETLKVLNSYLFTCHLGIDFLPWGHIMKQKSLKIHNL